MEKDVYKSESNLSRKDFCKNKKSDNNSIVNSHIDKFNLKEHSLDDVARPLDIGYEVKK